MNGLGYAPVCSSSALSKTDIFRVYGITAPFFKKVQRFCTKKNAAVIPKQFDLAKVWDRAVFSFY